MIKSLWRAQIKFRTYSDSSGCIFKLTLITQTNFKIVFENKELDDFKQYSFSKYTTNDILFNGNRGAIGTGFIDFILKNLFLAHWWHNLNKL